MRIVNNRDDDIKNYDYKFTWMRLSDKIVPPNASSDAKLPEIIINMVLDGLIQLLGTSSVAWISVLPSTPICDS